MANPSSPNFLTCPAFPELTGPSESNAPQSPVPPAHETPPTPTPRRRPYWRWVAFALVTAFFVMTVLPAISLIRAAANAREAKAILERSVEKARIFDAEGAQADLVLARDRLQAAREQLQATGFWRDVPGIGRQLRALEDASAAGAETIDAASNLAEVFQVIIEALRGGSEATTGISTGIAPTRNYNDLSQEEKRELLRKFADALPNIRLARDKIDLAVEVWNRVPQESMFAPLRKALQPLATALPTLKRTLDESVPLIETAVPLAGYPERLRYLVLLQNSDEIRPSGGFIGTIGTMTLDAGNVTEFSFDDVYNIDNPSSYAWNETPPKPIAERLGLKNWYLRDANWSPDFPETGARLLDFYRREVELGTGKPLPNPPNAVLAFEPGFFEDLLRVTGPVQAAGKTFTDQNFFDLLEYQVERGYYEQGVPLENRKEVIEQLGAALVEKMKSMPASRWPELVDLMTRSLERKQIMVYAKPPQLLSVLDQRGWTGRTKPTVDDFVWVIDANLAALKTDGVMEKNARYDLDATDPKNVRATVTLTYRNTNRVITWRYSRYRSYTRVYVPEGSEFISSSGSMKDDRYKTGGVAVAGTVDVTKELGKTVFGTFWSIEPGQTGTLSFTYKLPPSVAARVQSGSYQLDWPKQAGVDNSQLTVDLKFGKTLQSAEPPEEQSKWGDSRYEHKTDSLEDRVFKIIF